jgi:hypothetical protein
MPSRKSLSLALEQVSPGSLDARPGSGAFVVAPMTEQIRHSLATVLVEESAAAVLLRQPDAGPGRHDIAISDEPLEHLGRAGDAAAGLVDLSESVLLRLLETGALLLQTGETLFEVAAGFVQMVLRLLDGEPGGCYCAAFIADEGLAQRSYRIALKGCVRLCAVGVQLGELALGVGQLFLPDVGASPGLLDALVETVKMALVVVLGFADFLLPERSKQRCAILEIATVFHHRPIRVVLERTPFVVLARTTVR